MNFDHLNKKNVIQRAHHSAQCLCLAFARRDRDSENIELQFHFNHFGSVRKKIQRIFHPMHSRVRRVFLRLPQK